MTVAPDILDTFHRVLVDEIRRKRPEYLKGPFTVAEIYQDLAPYPTHRDRIGVEINGDYEDALMRLLAGEGGYLILESEHALRQLKAELQSKNPNTGAYREFAAVDVRLAPGMLDPAGHAAVVPATDASRKPAEGKGAGPERADRGSAVSASAGPQSGGAAEAQSGPGGAAEPAGTSEAPTGHADCAWCQAPLPARSGLKFCPFCGADVRVVPCSGCGEELEPDWRFCIACGTERPS